MNAEPSACDARETLVGTLKRFSLTYEQHQLLHGDGIGLLATQLAAKRARFTTLLLILAGLFGILAVRGMVSGGSFTLWAICLGVCAVWAWRRHANTVALRNAAVAYAAGRSETESIRGTLADELRIGFKLQYDEYQALHSGNAVLAAEKIIGRCKANTGSAIRGGVFLSSFGLLWIVASLFSDTSVGWGFGVWLSLTCIATFCVVAIAIADRATIARVNELLRKHAPGAEVSD